MVTIVDGVAFNLRPTWGGKLGPLEPPEDKPQTQGAPPSPPNGKITDGDQEPKDDRWYLLKIHTQNHGIQNLRVQGEAFAKKVCGLACSGGLAFPAEDTEGDWIYVPGNTIKGINLELLGAD